jgi:hypothetical protein
MHALVVQALRQALDAEGEHRLYRAGKWPGLFAARTGAAGDAAAQALRDELLEVTRIEEKGKTRIEWVRLTPRGVAYLSVHDSPRAVLDELRSAVQATQAGVPIWMEEMREQLADLANRFAAEADRALSRLARLEERLSEALRRLDASGPGVSESLASHVPWGQEALAYLDARKEHSANGCPLPELFEALRPGHPELSVTEFHDGLRRLRDVRALRLSPGETMDRPEYALPDGGDLLYRAER